jgi:hypothetical protein
MSETFELGLHGITDTVAIADYEMVSPTVARVIISYTGSQTPSKIAAAVAKLTGNEASIVENSFRKLTASSAVGYIRANREIRPVTENEIRASYKSASANILMSNEDDSLWEVKKVGGQTYLAKQNTDNLEDLVTAVLNTNTLDAPKLRVLSSLNPQKNELVAFVSDAGDVDYGFVTALGKDSVKIESKTTLKPVVASKKQIIASYEVEIDKETDTAVRHSLSKRIRAAAKTDADVKATMSEYYNELFGYDPAYLAEVIKQINETSFA